MALTPPGYKLGDGVFVAVQGQGVADRGHRRRRQGRQGDRRRHRLEGDSATASMPSASPSTRTAASTSGLGTADFTNAYLIDKETGQVPLRPRERTRHDPEGVRPTSRSARSSAPASASRWAWRSTATATCSAPTRRGRPGCPTATRSTNCCTSSRAGTTASRRGTRSTCPSVIDEPSVFDYGAAAPVDLRPELQRAGQRRPDLRPRVVGRRRPGRPATRAASSTAPSWSRRRPATSPRTSCSPA